MCKVFMYIYSYTYIYIYIIYLYLYLYSCIYIYYIYMDPVQTLFVYQICIYIYVCIELTSLNINLSVFGHAILLVDVRVWVGVKERCWSWHEGGSWARVSSSLGSRGAIYTSSSERCLVQWCSTLPQARPLACCASGCWQVVCSFSLSDVGSPTARIQYRQEIRNFELKLSCLLQEGKNYKVDRPGRQIPMWWRRIQWSHWDMEQSCSNHQSLLVHRRLLCKQWSTPPWRTHAVVGIFDCMPWEKF